MTRENQPADDWAVRAVIQKLEDLQRAGLTHIGKLPARSAPAVKPPASETRPQPGRPAPKPAPAGHFSGGGDQDRAAALAGVQRKVAACVRCAELARTRTQTVFGDGNPHARLAFLGEAPGADEDRLGKPFVGRAGQLLTDIIEKGMQIKRSDVYILNVLRCRPPGNRNPLPHEAANCREYLDRQLEIVQPEFICCLGAVAAQNLLGTTETIGNLRGRFRDYKGIKVLCTYHPAYVLRNPSAKREVWKDIQILMAEMGLKISKQS